MPEYLAPGVYVEEIHTGPRPIEGVSTSTAGFVGETERGPTRPTLVTSWADYQRRFGGYIDRPPMNASTASAVRGARLLRQRRTAAVRRAGRRARRRRWRGAARRDSRDRPRSRPSVRAPGATAFVCGRPGVGGVDAPTGSDQPGAAVVPHSASSTTARSRRPFVDPTDPSSSPNPNRREPDAFEDFDNLSPVPTRQQLRARRSSTARRG